MYNDFLTLRYFTFNHGAYYTSLDIHFVSKKQYFAARSLEL